MSDVRFCNYCDCADCLFGTAEMRHAKTVSGDWICAACFEFEVCLDQQSSATQRREPCPPGPCPHRPQLVSEWSSL